MLPEMARRLRTWWALPGSNRSILLLMLLSLPLISVVIRLAGYVRTRRWIERLSPVTVWRTPTVADLQFAEGLARMAAIAGRRGAVTATCLRQSLLVYGWLRCRGLAPDLKLGVRIRAGQFDAHAWVQLQQVALGQDDLTHTPLPDRAFAVSIVR